MSLQGPGSTFLCRTAFRSLQWDVVGQSQPAQGQSPSALPQGSCCCHLRAITLRLLRDWLSTLTSRLRGREELSQACERWWQSLGAQQRPRHWTGWLGNQPPKWRKIDLAERRLSPCSRCLPRASRLCSGHARRPGPSRPITSCSNPSVLLGTLPLRTHHPGLCIQETSE